ncbi:GDP-L-fucose synthase family protein [Belliella kenyensis]|uniref:GDP-L-fucose synthase n=1 Tax=Belliella kenyensis TaxID=1472724 RepID=A0ABV8EMW0_9BACT|nr:GDP-L-fucose synthase [Belliella kenyensis]MCH7403667.1 GDP-L-fucose synthase [Belliella kenyensis]MDN3602179.1 GDP-L-fucose synthase [Belliella kenyensis]
MINKETKIYVAGHRGMVGSAIVNHLKELGYQQIVTRRSGELDLRNQLEVEYFFSQEKPKVVIDAAARVGGILANRDYPYQFLMDNLKIQNNLMEFSLLNDCEKFIFLGSSCIYPKFSPQPIKEEYLLTSELEPTNEAYALAKISGVKTCEYIRKQFGKDYSSLMPTNLYGPRDNFDLETSHVLPAMITKFHEAMIQGNLPVILWGTGSPMREFLHVDDLASAVIFALENQLPDNLYNVGTGEDITIKDLALLIQQIVGHRGEIIWDDSKPDGTPRKLLDVSKLKSLGWEAKTSLKKGIIETYEWYLENSYNLKKVKIS